MDTYNIQHIRLICLGILIVLYCDAFTPDEKCALPFPILFQGHTPHTHISISEEALALATLGYAQDNKKQSTRELKFNINNTDISKLVSQVRNEITFSNAEVDSSYDTAYLPAAHYDDEKFVEANSLLIDLKEAITTSIFDGDYKYARYLTGKYLHTLQDFYSHSNWVELNNTESNRYLGVFGKSVGNVASPNEATCQTCTLDRSFALNCKENILTSVIQKNMLTSGYYSAQRDNNGKEVTKNIPNGKCYYGGSKERDLTANLFGGINKDSNNEDLSPHYYLHDKAAAIATDASYEFLNGLRFTVGDDQFGRFLKIGHCSSFGFVFAVDGNAAKRIIGNVRQVLSNLKRKNTSPTKYICLAAGLPYDKEAITSDQDVFQMHLNQVEKSLIGTYWKTADSFINLNDDIIENAIRHSDTDSPLFIFTSSSVNDITLRIQSLAIHWNVKLYFLLTDHNATFDENLLKKARSTGGDVIDINKVDVTYLVQTMEAEVLKQLVTVVYDEIDQPPTIDGNPHLIPIDDTLSNVFVEIAGNYKSLNFTDSSGNYRMLTESPGSSNNSRFFRFPTNEPGIWILTVSSNEKYSVRVKGWSKVDVTYSLHYLVYKSRHPVLHRINGKPTVGSDYFMAVFVGGISVGAHCSSASVDIIDISGRTIHMFNASIDSINTNLTIPVKFNFGEYRLRITCIDLSGHILQRIASRAIQTTSSKLGLTKTPSTTLIKSGEVTKISFNLQNLGERSIFEVFADDDDGYVTEWRPHYLSLGRHRTSSGEVTLRIPNDAIPGKRILIVISVSSGNDNVTHNSIVFTSSVKMKILDHFPPSCTVNMKPNNCSSNDNCSLLSWSAEGTILDSGIGIQRIEKIIGEGALTLANFSGGDDVDEVHWNYTSNCCSLNLNLAMFDLAGNYAECDLASASEFNDSLYPHGVKLVSPGLSICIIVILISGVTILIILWVRSHFVKQRYRNVSQYSDNDSTDFTDTQV
ncbi:von Willebrand factor A domain-containing protein 7-like [Anneissia japonica]|uniref:von Willebrand factor A domain-containing protein 7-like n=1 Tax=Anneissia japonica TaxID=1529436 RepID=UPI001425614A|nr:von Willebrand factor A domain-containing protein 7-like [Anneissia japonica]XP_033097986.1 von Willebrand factor A domain-containing protein 7-like [Anneissia japonica]